MRLFGIALIWTLVGVGACDKGTLEPAAVSQDTTAPTTAKNAGEAYDIVFQAMGSSTSTIDMDKLGQDAELLRCTPQIEQLIEQSKALNTDFGTDYSKGMNAELPHLPQMRAFTRILSADTKRLIAAGDNDAACKRIAATMRLGTQVAKSAQTQIELLVAMAMTSRATSNIIDNPQLASAPWKTDVQNAIVSATDAVVNRSLDAVKKDFDMVIRDLRANNIPNLSSDEFANMGKNWPAATPAEREEAAKNVEAFGKEVENVWNSSGATDKIKSMTTAREGKLGMDLMGATWKLRKSIDETKEQLAKAASVLNK